LRRTRKNSSRFLLNIHNSFAFKIFEPGRMGAWSVTNCRDVSCKFIYSS
jgi:hypothetical protein